jgi:hypothetical protein
VPEPSVDPVDWHRARKESQWRSDDGILLDLHSRLGDHPTLLPTATASAAARMVEIPGASPCLPCRTGCFCPTSRYMALRAPGSALNGWPTSRTGRAHPPEQLQVIAEQAPRLGAGRSLAASLILANRLLGKGCRKDWMRIGATLRLVRLAVGALSDPGEPTERRFGTLPMHRSQLLLVPGSHYFLSEVMRKLGLLLIR